MLITFSGLDGSGKTTLIAQLIAALEASGRSVEHYTMYDDIGLYSIIRRMRGAPWDLPKDADQQPAAVASLPKPSSPSRVALHAALKVVRGRATKALLLPFDVSLFVIKRHRVTKRADVMILDRYFYDSIVELRGEESWWARIFLAALPAPELSVFVDVDPAVAFGRKGEYSIPELSRREWAYRWLFGRLPHGVVIRNDSLPEARAQLLKTAFDRLGSPS